MLSKYLLINNTEGKFGSLRVAMMGTNNPKLIISKKAVNDDKIIKYKKNFFWLNSKIE